MTDTHLDIADRLSEYLDGELDRRDRALVDEHLAACASCRKVVAELRTIIDGAGALPGGLPGRELWEGIEVRIGTEATPALPFDRVHRRTFAFTVPQLAAAGIALMVLSGGIVYMAGPGNAPRAAVEIPRGSRTLGVSTVSLADPRYDDAVQDLERTLAEGRGRLDAETVRVLEQNLATIDKAIAQSREALEADPGNIFLNSHLVSARQRKLALLRRATALTTGS